MTPREELNHIIQFGAMDIAKKVISRVRSVPAKLKDLSSGYAAARQVSPAGGRMDALLSSVKSGLKKKEAGGYGDLAW